MNHLRDGHEYLDTMRELGRTATRAALSVGIGVALLLVESAADAAVFESVMLTAIACVCAVAGIAWTVKMNRASRRLDEISRRE
jgi:hypothetical protein